LQRVENEFSESTFENQRQHLNNSMMSKISKISEKGDISKKNFNRQDFNSVRSSLDSEGLKTSKISKIDRKNTTFVALSKPQDLMISSEKIKKS
jgi:hypothetical protein